jgi:hypothetical protein
MLMLRILAIAALLGRVASLVIVTAPGLAVASNAAAECKPEFAYRTEWMGADATYSTRISHRKIFWSFGDTFYGKTALAREGMVRNSVATSRCIDGKFVIRYAGKVDAVTGQQVDFFESPEAKQWYWPKGSLLYKKKLYVFLSRMGKTTDAVFPFELLGTDIAIIKNPQANPLDWDIQYRTFIDSTEIHAASAVVRAGKYAYIYSTVDSINGIVQPVVLYRVRLDSLPDAASHIEYLSNSRGNVWKKGIEFGDARIVLETGATEFSVHWDREAEAWRLVIIGRAFFDDKAIYTSLSSRLAKPWDKLEYLKHIDDAQGQICYAAKNIEGYDGFLHHCQWLDGRTKLDLDVYRPVVTDY